MEKFTLSLTLEHLTVIDMALQEMPLRLAYPVVAEINRQIEAQKKPQTDGEAAGG